MTKPNRKSTKLLARTSTSLQLWEGMKNLGQDSNQQVQSRGDYCVSMRWQSHLSSTTTAGNGRGLEMEFGNMNHLCCCWQRGIYIYIYIYILNVTERKESAPASLLLSRWPSPHGLYGPVLLHTGASRYPGLDRLYAPGAFRPTVTR